MAVGPRHSGKPDLATRLRRAWLVFSVLWVLGAVGYATYAWDRIYPERPNYLIVPNETREKLVVWYSTDAAVPVDQFKREHQITNADEVSLGRNTLLLPRDLSAEQKKDFLIRARDMDGYLVERFYRGIAFRFVPILLLFVLGPPLLVLLLGRATRMALIRWVGG